MDYIELRSLGEGHGPDGILRTTTGILPVLGGTPKMNVLKKIYILSSSQPSNLRGQHLNGASTAARSGLVIRADEIRKGDGQIQFSLAILDTAQLRPKTKIDTSNSARPRPSTGEAINLSGSQVLVGSVSALCGTSLLFWAFLKLWLFE